jgi:hypothetical protein
MLFIIIDPCLKSFPLSWFLLSIFVFKMKRQQHPYFFFLFYHPPNVHLFSSWDYRNHFIILSLGPFLSLECSSCICWYIWWGPTDVRLFIFFLSTLQTAISVDPFSVCWFCSVCLHLRFELFLWIFHLHSTFQLQNIFLLPFLINSFSLLIFFVWWDMILVAVSWSCLFRFLYVIFL